jgi:hypothetical protein
MNSPDQLQPGRWLDDNIFVGFKNIMGGDRLMHVYQCDYYHRTTSRYKKWKCRMNILAAASEYCPMLRFYGEVFQQQKEFHWYLNYVYLSTRTWEAATPDSQWVRYSGYPTQPVSQLFRPYQTGSESAIQAIPHIQWVSYSGQPRQPVSQIFRLSHTISESAIQAIPDSQCVWYSGYPTQPLSQIFRLSRTTSESAIQAIPDSQRANSLAGEPNIEHASQIVKEAFNHSLCSQVANHSVRQSTSQPTNEHANQPAYQQGNQSASQQ